MKAEQRKTAKEPEAQTPTTISDLSLIQLMRARDQAQQTFIAIETELARRDAKG